MCKWVLWQCVPPHPSNCVQSMRFTILSVFLSQTSTVWLPVLLTYTCLSTTNRDIQASLLTRPCFLNKQINILRIEHHRQEISWKGTFNWDVIVFFYVRSRQIQFICLNFTKLLCCLWHLASVYDLSIN